MFAWLKARRERREQFLRAVRERMEVLTFLPTVTRDDVLRIIRRDFPDAPPDEVLADLRVYGPAEHHLEAPRVHAAILKLSEGERGRIGHFAQLAARDFRDVLMLAEMPGFFKAMVPVEEFAKRPVSEIDSIAKSDRNQYLEWFNRPGVS